MLSRRSSFDLRPNRLSLLLAEKESKGLPVLDLTESNPTRCGFVHPGPEALAALADPAALLYDPQPFGRPEARAAVAAYYRDRGEEVDPARLLLTASTSEAYAFLFKLLADDGDEVLVPQPSYPLFDYLARCEGINVGTYPLETDSGFRIDFPALASNFGPRTRAVLLVSPNNPTGSVVSRQELAELDVLAADHGIAVLCDEVFADFPFTPGGEAPVAATRAREALTFSLSGISKVCGLPQMKLGWLVPGGPSQLVATALARLELIADTFLSVGTPVQVAAPRLLAARGGFLAECLARVRANRALVAARVARVPAVTLLPAEAGWYACLRLPRVRSEEELVLELLESDGVAVHPGYFFDFNEESYLVVSLIVPTERLAEGLDRILARVAGGA